MRFLPCITLFVFLILANVAIANRPILEHEVPSGIIRGEKATLEVISANIGYSVQDMRLYYRELGDATFKQQPMKQDGYVYYAEINTQNITSGRIEYYIGYEGSLGMTGTLPEENPEINLFALNVAPAQEEEQPYSDLEIVILSPDPDEMVSSNEVLIAASFIGGETEIDVSLSKLFIDEIDVSPAADFSDGILTYVPAYMRAGRHNIILQLFNNTGELISSKEWAFRIIEPAEGIRAINLTGSVFIDNRNQTLSETSDHFLSGGGYISGNYQNWDFYSKILFSSEESKGQQPVNRFSGEVQYHLTDRSRLYLFGGDFIPYYNPLVFQDKRVRGVQAGLMLGFFTLDYVLGQTYRKIEGRKEIDESSDTLRVNGTYTERIMAIRPGFRFGDRAHWNLNLVNSKQDPQSIEYGGNAKEALIVGTDLSLNFDRRKILFEASAQASIKNTDAGSPEIEYDDLVEVDSSLADNQLGERAFDLIKKSGFLTPTAGLSIYPSLAVQFDLYLKYLNNNLKLTYLNIENEFESPGNPYLLKDISGFYVSDHIRLFQNQLFLNPFVKLYQNNISEDTYATDNTEWGTTLSYFPYGNLPSMTVGYSSHHRNNAVTAQDTIGSGYLYMEDNMTRRITLSSSYRFNLKSIRNTLSINSAGYLRDDHSNPEGNSDFISLTAALQTKIRSPLTTKLSYNWSGTTYGDTLKSTIHINRINFRIDYRLLELFGEGSLRSFVNLSLQKIASETTVSDAVRSNRNNYAVGLIYQQGQWGVISIRFDQINYVANDENITDRIFQVRYEKNF